MAVYATMIRDDPDSRARMRVTPEQALNLPVHYCLASWIAGGSRAASFIGETFPFPQRSPTRGRDIHLERLAREGRPLPGDDGLDARARRPPPTRRRHGAAQARVRPRSEPDAAPRATPELGPANTKRERPSRRAAPRRPRRGNAADGTATPPRGPLARRTGPRV